MTATASPPPNNTPVIAPMRGERQDCFVERADRALRKRIVDRNSRMSAIMQAWQDSGEEASLQRRVRESLASSVDCDPREVYQHFITRPNRPIFPEHETRDANGRLQRYDRAALGAIVDRLNRRIMDTGDLSAMSAGHTPTADQQATGMPMPDMVGYSGPFRLGLIGHDQPRWAIFADEHIFRDDWPRVRKMSRRSPEVWMEPRMEDRILDPIAVLGAETPRLDTGIGRFSRRLDPARYQNVQRYSYGAAMPGAMNTFTPSMSAAELARNSMGSPQESSDMDQNAIDQIVSSVIEGIAATPQWAWLTDQMQADGNPVPEEADMGPPSSGDNKLPDQSVGGMPPEQMNPAEPNPATTLADPSAGSPDTGTDTGDAPPDSPTPGDAAGDVGDDSGATDDELGQMAPDEKDDYSRLAPSHQYGYMRAWRRHAKNITHPSMASNRSHYAKGEGVDKERYSRLERDVTRLAAENAQLRADHTYRDRYSKLSELAQTHEFNVDEEADDCRQLTDTAFDRHLERIQSRYSRRDPNGGMPSLYLPPLQTVSQADEATRERYSRRAVELASRSNGTVSYAQALEQAKAEVMGKSA